MNRIYSPNKSINTLELSAQSGIFIEIIDATLSEKKAEIDIHLKRLSNSNLKEKLNIFCKEYVNSKSRLKYSNQKNDFYLKSLREMTEDKLMNRQIQMIFNTIKQQDDLFTLQRVIEMTNQSKIYTAIVGQKQLKWNQVSKAVPNASYPLIQALHQRLKEEKKESLKAIETLERLKLENKAYQTEAAKLKVDLQICSQNMKNIISKHEQETNRLNAQMVTRAQSENASQQKIKDLQVFNIEHKIKISQLQDILEQKSNKIVAQKEKIAKLEKENKELNKAEDMMARLQKRIKDYQLQIDGLNHQINVLNSTIQEMNGINKPISRNENSLEKSITIIQHNDIVKQLSTQNDALKEQLGKVRQQLRTKVDQINQKLFGNGLIQIIQSLKKL